MSTLVKYSAKNFRAMRDWIIVKNMEFSERKLSSGILLPSDNRTTHGIRPRWGEVVAVGPEQQDVKVGQYVLVSHGRWTRAIQVQWDGIEEPINIQRVDNAEIRLGAVGDPFIAAVGELADKDRRFRLVEAATERLDGNFVAHSGMASGWGGHVSKRVYIMKLGLVDSEAPRQPGKRRRSRTIPNPL